MDSQQRTGMFTIHSNKHRMRKDCTRNDSRQSFFDSRASEETRRQVLSGLYGSIYTIDCCMFMFLHWNNKAFLSIDDLRGNL